VVVEGLVTMPVTCSAEAIRSMIFEGEWEPGPTDAPRPEATAPDHRMPTTVLDGIVYLAMD